MTARVTPVLVAITGVGVLLRVLTIGLAEHRLDADESLIAVMGVDILEGRSLPYFVYFTSYDGGGVVEAYLAALGFALFGVGESVLKLAVLGVWTGAALLFAGLCGRALSPRRAVIATALFSLGTPFFVEWSVKARGGYEETLLIGIALLWLGEPPARLRSRTRGLGFAFGLLCGIGMWVSEMLLPLIPGALGWLVARRDASERRARLLALSLGGLIGLAPLVFYNVTHDWANLRGSVVFRLLEGDSRPPLMLAQLADSARFVLGPLWGLGVAALAVAAARLAAERDRLTLEHVLAISLGIYVLGYWLNGLRFLDFPPSRVLYQTAPAVAVLLAVAVDPGPQWKSVRGALATLVLALWSASEVVSLVAWWRSGEPREAGSWRSTFSLIDAPRLHGLLLEEGVDFAFAGYWSAWPLQLEVARARRAGEPGKAINVSVALPPGPLPAGRRAAFVLNHDAPLLADIEARLAASGAAVPRHDLGPLTVLAPIDASRVHTKAGFPRVLMDGALPPLPEVPDGFN